jgi:hypothetical protein
VSSGLTKPLKNGKRVELKPCDASDCPVCAPELARDYIEAMRLAAPNAFVVIELPASRLTKTLDPPNRLRDIVGKARHRLGDIAWAWYAEEDGASVIVHAAVAVRSIYRPTSIGALRQHRPRVRGRIECIHRFGWRLQDERSVPRAPRRCELAGSRRSRTACRGTCAMERESNTPHEQAVLVGRGRRTNRRLVAEGRCSEAWSEPTEEAGRVRPDDGPDVSLMIAPHPRDTARSVPIPTWTGELENCREAR